MTDNEIEAGTNPSNVLVCGFSQGGRSLSLRTHIYTVTLNWSFCRTSWRSSVKQAGVSCGLKAYPGLGHSVTNEELKKPGIMDQKLIYVVRS
ncbi:carboxylesterase SOBER1-like [Pyrus communis]|uniref:carboxylesterase SOBER1-like n=1 Tax=Pyrus communis TaxID=23211 RepID=UPI0035BFFA21